MRLLLVILTLFSVINLNAQQRFLSSEAEISVLTIGPGKNLNDAFGHSGFRVKDPQVNLDIVYNYGVYDFTTKNFYLKFAQGKLNYKIESDPFQPFFDYYKRQDRSIDEQVLNLTQVEKQAVFDYLLNNMRPEKQFYLYDFFYDNCATKIKDVLEASIGDISFKAPANFENSTFRELIYEHVDKNTWGSFGIDVALGSVIDQNATYEEQMYLPVYIHEFFAHANLNSQKNLVKHGRSLYKKQQIKESGNLITSPFFLFLLIGGFILFLTYRDNRKRVRTKWLDICLFGLTGLIGVAVLLLWFATDHSATANNYNLLWAFALNLVVIGQLRKKKLAPWFVKYLKFLIILLCLLSLHWLIGVQTFAITLTPFIIALGIRYFYLVKSS